MDYAGNALEKAGHNPGHNEIQDDEELDLGDIDGERLKQAEVGRQKRIRPCRRPGKIQSREEGFYFSMRCCLFADHLFECGS